MPDRPAMKDPAAFFKVRALTEFRRRKLYPIGSEDRAISYREARWFIDAYRRLTANRSAAELDAEIAKLSPDVIRAGT